MFDLQAAQTTLRREILGGLTTFVTMSYIIVVNPIILGDAKVPFQQAFIATIIATIVGTLIMALFARYPIAIAPGMGMNAYFAYSVVQAHKGIDYRVAFSAVFLATLIFALISLTPLRTKLIEAIPVNLKHAITAGIGLFIAFLGLRMTGIIQATNSSNLVGLGNLHSISVLLTLIGLVVTLICMALNLNGALFFGMLVTGIIAFATGQISFSKGIASLPPLEGLVAYNPVTAIGDVIHYGLYGAIFSFVLVTLFDTTGTILGVAEQAGLMKNGKLPRIERALLADSLGALVGSMFGTTPTTAYIESASGVAAGGRTGLTALVVALLFAVAAFFSPLVGAISGVAAITGPALIIVGALMLSSVSHIEWERFDEVFPAFLVILSMPLTSSIATGIAFGFIFYPIMKIFRGQWRAVHPLVYIFAVLFLLMLIFAPPS